MSELEERSKKLKFDKKGSLILQKLNLDVKHDERTKDLIDNIKKEKLKGEIETKIMKL